MAADNCAAGLVRRLQESGIRERGGDDEPDAVLISCAWNGGQFERYVDIDADPDEVAGTVLARAARLLHDARRLH